jgi:cell division protease FtsH
MALGGRASEEIIFGKISTGALSDLERVTKLAYSMVTIYGMNSKIGNISFYDSKQTDYNFTKPYSEATAETIDAEVRKLVEEAYERTKILLLEKKEKVEILAKKLLEKEIIFQSDLEGLIGKRPFAKPTTYEAYTKKDDEEEKTEESADKDISNSEELAETPQDDNLSSEEKVDEVKEVSKEDKIS